ncbi:hypothetical protein [Azonexus sp.]|uniref:hypothetical protein n=1 Tax=Azonexus sp. TaxID=1872668 RepID=UPI0035B2D509
MGRASLAIKPLASASLVLADLPASTGKKLPRYPTVPAIRMGRLAVDQAFKGQGRKATTRYRSNAHGDDRVSQAARQDGAPAGATAALGRKTGKNARSGVKIA